MVVPVMTSKFVWIGMQPRALQFSRDDGPAAGGMVRQLQGSIILTVGLVEVF